MKGEKKTWRYSDSDIWYVKLVNTKQNFDFAL